MRTTALAPVEVGFHLWHLPNMACHHRPIQKYGRFERRRFFFKVNRLIYLPFTTGKYMTAMSFIFNIAWLEPIN